ncbi:lipase member H-like [Contarinia nasturtii]|uniref:lipase member H-like n=1 Tax=Contarinia nasturtii TaxID=265458 RepID=UPI0012D42439|nr:lipase member H-like [Contarinia nasturtii]
MFCRELPLLFFTLHLSVFAMDVKIKNTIDSTVQRLLTSNIEKEIKISCVSKENAAKFETYHLKYDAEMENYKFKFNQSEMGKIKELIGKREKISLFFLGYEEQLSEPSGKEFTIEKAQMKNTNACSCVVSYDFLVFPLFKMLHYNWVLETRLPKVIKMTTAFIQNIVDSNALKINLSSVYLSGYSLGAHIVGSIGLKLKRIYNGQMVPVIWAFEPPILGFHPDKVKPRRIQKGDGQKVVLFRTSQYGVQTSTADVEIVLNEGKNQPGCAASGIVDKILCDHKSAIVLRELIIQRSKKLTLSNGIPCAYMNKTSIGFILEITNPTPIKDGTYYIHTGKLIKFSHLGK